eukprot:5060836-Alexandrium_andersonii.AAC.1
MRQAPIARNARRRNPPALRAAILRGAAAQHARGGRCFPASLERRLAQGGAVVDLMEESPGGDWELQSIAQEAALKRGPAEDVLMGDAV